MNFNFAAYVKKEYIRTVEILNKYKFLYSVMLLDSNFGF